MTRAGLEADARITLASLSASAHPRGPVRYPCPPRRGPGPAQRATGQGREAETNE